MSSLVEALTVVFRNTNANMKLKGGSGSLCDIAPNETYRTDGFLSAVGFMNPRDAKYFVDQLEAIGFVFIEQEQAIDIAICDQNEGFTSACDWLETEKNEFGVRYCWLLGKPKGIMATPLGWSLETSLYHTGSFIPDEEIPEQIKFLRTENGLDVYWNEKLGKETYTNRPFDNGDEINQVKKKAKVFISSVKMLYDTLLAQDWMGIQVRSEIECFPHLIMRYENQLCVVFVELIWNAQKVTDLDSSSKKRLLDLAQQVNAVPIVASIELQWLEPSQSDTAIIKDVQPKSLQNHLVLAKQKLLKIVQRIMDKTERNSLDLQDQENGQIKDGGQEHFQFQPVRHYLFHNLLTNRELKIEEYDLDEKIEMSDLEFHNFGIQIVRENLNKDSCEVIEYNSDREALIQVQALIKNQLTYILVRTLPSDIKGNSIDDLTIRNAAAFAARNEAVLKMVTILVASKNSTFDPSVTKKNPIYRGCELLVSSSELENPTIQYDG